MIYQPLFLTCSDWISCCLPGKSQELVNDMFSDHPIALHAVKSACKLNMDSDKPTLYTKFLPIYRIIKSHIDAHKLQIDIVLASNTAI